MEKIRINQCMVSVLTLAGAFMLAGCGGGGVTPLTPEQAFERTTSASLRAIADVADRQSRREGDLGGRGAVYAQISNNPGPYMVTVSVANDVEGALVYEWSRTYGGATPLTLTVNSGTDIVLDQQASTMADDVSSVFLYKELADGGKLWVGFNTDYVVGSSDSDYLVGGIWSYAPSDPNSDHEFGAFAYGNDIFDNPDGILGLGGTGGSTSATVVYSGKARGIYTAEQQNRFFDASVILRARFDTGASDIGLLGSMGNFRMKLADGSYEDIDISDRFFFAGSLPSTGVNYAGSFTGRICVLGSSCSGVDVIGKFGGQFYGNGDTATSTDYPRSIAGTFGTTQGTAENQKSFLGAFGLHRP